MPTPLEITETDEALKALLSGTEISDKKLYVIEVTVQTNRNYSLTTLAKFPLTLWGKRHLDQEGRWTTTAVGYMFFWQLSGHWRTLRLGDEITISLERIDFNTISFLWKGLPGSVGSIGGILKFPLSLGETGNGSVYDGHGSRESEDAPTLPYYTTYWKVVERTF